MGSVHKACSMQPDNDQRNKRRLVSSRWAGQQEFLSGSFNTLPYSIRLKLHLDITPFGIRQVCTHVDWLAHADTAGRNVSECSQGKHWKGIIEDGYFALPFPQLLFSANQVSWNWSVCVSSKFIISPQTSVLCPLEEGPGRTACPFPWGRDLESCLPLRHGGGCWEKELSTSAPAALTSRCPTCSTQRNSLQGSHLHVSVAAIAPNHMVFNMVFNSLFFDATWILNLKFYFL